MPQKSTARIAVIGIDIGKNSFHVVGLNEALLSVGSATPVGSMAHFRELDRLLLHQPDHDLPFVLIRCATENEHQHAFRPLRPRRAPAAQSRHVQLDSRSHRHADALGLHRTGRTKGFARPHIARPGRLLHDELRRPRHVYRQSNSAAGRESLRPRRHRRELRRPLTTKELVAVNGDFQKVKTKELCVGIVCVSESDSCECSARPQPRNRPPRAPLWIPRREHHPIRTRRKFIHSGNRKHTACAYDRWRKPGAHPRRRHLQRPRRNHHRARARRKLSHQNAPQRHARLQHRPRHLDCYNRHHGATLQPTAPASRQRAPASGAPPSEVDDLARTVAQSAAQRALLAASRRRSLSIAQAA